MNNYLSDLVRHNAWATDQLLTFCKDLDERVLTTRVPGTYGSILETFNHYVTAEASYLRRASHAWPEIPWDTTVPVGFHELARRAALLAETWQAFLAGGLDIDRMDEARGADGMEFAVPVGVFITQALHHGNEHRAHIGTQLGVQGIEGPEVSAWLYGLESARSHVTFWPEGVTTW